VVEDRKADPPNAVGGLEDIEKRVGSWGKKTRKKERERKRRGASTSGLTSAAQQEESCKRVKITAWCSLNKFPKGLEQEIDFRITANSDSYSIVARVLHQPYKNVGFLKL